MPLPLSTPMKSQSKRSAKKEGKRQGEPQPPPGPRFPNRWSQYSPISEIISGTRFIAFKTPLSDKFFQGKSSPKFGLKNIVEHVSSLDKTLGLVVDLTATTRYYDASEWTNYDVQYEKIFCEGHSAHLQTDVIQHFIKVVKDYFSNHPGHNMIVGVHCTHGLNRTGYFICRYMIDEMDIEPSKAIKDFEAARGHQIERQLYLSSLQNNDVVKDSETTSHLKFSSLSLPEAWNDWNRIAQSDVSRRRPSENFNRRHRIRSLEVEHRSRNYSYHRNISYIDRYRRTPTFRARHRSLAHGRKNDCYANESPDFFKLCTETRLPQNSLALKAKRVSDVSTSSKHPRILPSLG